MSETPASIATANLSTRIQPGTRLDGRRLTLARLVWAVMTLVVIGVFIRAIPEHYRQLQVIVDSPTLAIVELSRAEAEALLSIGFTGESYAIWHVILHTAFALTCASVGMLMVWRRSDDWMVMFVGFTLTLYGTTYTPTIEDLARSIPAFTFPVNLLQQLSMITSVLTFFIFPDGRFVPRWTWMIAAVWSVWMAAAAFFPAINPVDWGDRIFDWVGLGIVVSAYGVGLYAQAHRYRRVSDQDQRQQTKWVVLSLAAAVSGITAFIIGNGFISTLEASGAVSLIYDMIGIPVTALVPVLLVPLGLGTALLRYRLWEVDFLINRSLVYGALTALLGLAFGGLVLAIQQILRLVTNNQQPTVAIALSALAIGVVFQPARRALRTFVDRRFYGINVDYKRSAEAMAAQGESLPAGSLVGLYKITQLIGQGGMAEVYRAVNLMSGSAVALKVLSRKLAADAAFRRRFEREAQIAAMLKHPNIVQMHDFGVSEGGFYYMAMEYVGGAPLSDLLKGGGPLALDRVRAIAADVASALDHAHGQGLVHRDVKPSNVLVETITAAGGAAPTQRAFLTDFGIARLFSAETRLTQSGIIGTFDYIAPEQIRDSALIDGRADVYALGVMLFQMLTGKLPFVASNPGALLISHLQQPAPDPRSLRPDLPPQVSYAILRALEKEPAQRFATPGDLARALGG